MGVMGAAYATFAAYLCAVGLSWQLGKREFVMPILSRDVIYASLSAAVMVVVAMLLLNEYDQTGIFNWTSMAVILFGVYAAMFFVLNVCELRTWLMVRVRAFLGRGKGL